MSAIYKTEAGGREVRERYVQALRAWPVPGEHRRVPTREGETFVVACGPEHAPPLLLLHGSGTNAAMWIGDVASWAGHFRVYAVDMIGEPGLSAPSRPPLDGEAYAHWLDDVLEGLGVARASVVGASLGGWLALDYAIRRPSRVSCLALLCPGGVGRQKYGWVVRALLLKPFGLRGARRTIRKVAGLDMPGAERFLEGMAVTFGRFRPRTERLPVFSDAALRGLSMPVLVIAGERDAMLDSGETARRLADAVPHAKVRLLPGVGHSVLGQTEVVLAHLREATAPGGAGHR
ncbi:alpha/beta fold hydrolase [Sphaerisporangium sp. TRM90804]|uniref:alpha/beta fold hydrolase n=1 Tax=Sphaerisporangium sp. TRM90804 TaxID=3031113 RepID=UPI00244A76C2|nr:alpha/beta fold hydrolase [Sphaerisporangium sp. TRM90804]MDH2430588.1 alpha/beta fold hydrolase [Sphaerisporangium sp. TRM90804]